MRSRAPLTWGTAALFSSFLPRPVGSVCAGLFVSLRLVKDGLLLSLLIAKYHSSFLFSSLIDIVPIDIIGGRFRFTLVYSLLSLHRGARLFVRVALDEPPFIESIWPVFPSAVWYERESWDMLGIFFYNHPDLRRILTDYGFRGHPIRKDFPLTGFEEVVYSDRHKSLVYAPVSLAQDYRAYLFFGPWRSVPKDIR